MLWPDKPVSYVLLPEDASGHHFGAFLRGPDAPSSAPAAPVAVISLFVEALPDTAPAPAAEGAVPKAARFRKFACDPSYQGQGIGTALLKAAFAAAKDEIGCAVVWCDARWETAPWYERRGMRCFGEHFFKGHIEYVRMKADL